MKTACFLFGIVLATSICRVGCCQETSDQQTTPIKPALRIELLACAEKDQAIRAELIKSGITNPNKILLDQMKSIDLANTNRLKEIVKDFGWPGYKLVGRDGADAAFLIVQHSDVQTQKAMLPLVEKSWKAEDFSAQNYALLLDRVLVSDGKPQVYGTQAVSFDQWIDGEPELAPIEDEKNVDERRRRIGLPPLAEYRKLLKQVYFKDR